MVPLIHYLPFAMHRINYFVLYAAPQGMGSLLSVTEIYALSLPPSSDQFNNRAQSKVSLQHSENFKEMKLVVIFAVPMKIYTVIFIICELFVTNV